MPDVSSVEEFSSSSFHSIDIDDPIYKTKSRHGKESRKALTRSTSENSDASEKRKEQRKRRKDARMNRSKLARKTLRANNMVGLEHIEGYSE